MSPSNDAKLKEVFGEAIELQGQERLSYLDRACAVDTDLRRRVDALLDAAERDGPFLRNATIESQIEVKPGEGAGTTIGVYKLLQLIGEGGFGSVFMAEQERPVRRRVALKVIKLGMDTRSVVARFEQERQALAVMDHPNIAKVLDAGATDTGRPFFVMELVKGEPITTYCDKANLTIEERLDLFTQVCLAVQHAHTKGVIHRDIKPSNILVSTQDGKALARVIDFGIAKATNHRMTEKTIFTEFRQLVGTPEYMSPEQAEGGLDVDTRTDVYSLGVLLYELLTGSTPFDPHTLRSAAYGEMQRIIREVEPPKPSTRLLESAKTLTNVAAHRRVEPARLGTIMRGELDWIVMKALEKDRGRRYESPSGLASDVKRYLTGEAVTAAPPRLGYRVRKFTRRHRVAVMAGSLVAAALMLGMIGTGVGLVNARAARDRAVAAEKLATDRLNDVEKARAVAERFNKIASAVTEFFTLDVLDLHAPIAGEPELTVREALDRVPKKIQDNFKSEPAVEGSIRERVGQLYLNMGDPRRATEYLVAAVPLLEKGLGPDDKATMRAQQRLGEVMIDLERYSEAEAAFDKVYQARLRTLGPNVNFTLNSFMRRGVARVYGGNVEQGLRDLEQGIAESRQKFGMATKTTVMFERELIEAYTAGGKADAAERLTREVIDRIHANAAELGPAENDFRALLGGALVVQKKYDQAIVELDAAWDVLKTQRPQLDDVVLCLRTNRGEALAALGRYGEAGVECAAVYAILEPLRGSNSPRCRKLAKMLEGISTAQGDDAAAARWRGRQ